MDEKLVAWARAVKARRRQRLPPLWLFTDEAAMPDLESVVASLPRALCGVVFRHDHFPGRAALLRRVARLCRQRRLVLVVAGPPQGRPPGAGRHLRAGRGPHAGVVTSSAHGRADIVRARRAGANAVFLSPAFPTASHPGAPSLGPCRWANLARGAAIPVLALGGITVRTAPRLPRWVAGAGAIGALVPDRHVSSAPQCFAFAIPDRACRLRVRSGRGNTLPRSG